MSILREQEPDDPGPAWPPCPFWDWSVAFYARPGVAEACLMLQDRGGHDVVLVLFALWLAERGARVDDGLAARALKVGEGWRDRVVAPLRTLRRQLKEGLAEPPHELAPEARQPSHVSALRARIKALELASERLQVLALADLVGDAPVAAEAGHELALGNLETLIAPAAADRPALSLLIDRISSPSAAASDD